MKQDILKELKRIVIEFDTDSAGTLAKKAVEQRIDPIKAAEALTEGIREVGDKFGEGGLFLPDLVCASEVVKNALPPIVAEIEKLGKTSKTLGKIIIDTVYGDIHSIGKSIVATFLFASGFEVIDLGINVKSEEFIDAVKAHDLNILAMSTLLTTTTMMEQKNVIEGLKKETLRKKIKVLVGGSPINQEFANSIGADGYGATAPEGVRVAKKLLGIG